MSDALQSSSQPVGADQSRESNNVIATIGTGPMEEVLSVSAPSMRRYADRHGYDFVIGDGYSAGRPASWGKVLLMRDLLDRYDTVVWIDSDAIVVDIEDDIVNELGPDDYQALALYEIADDWWGHHGNPGDELPNCGVWVLRGQRARDLMDKVWSMEEYADHAWWENAAMLELLGFSIYPCKRGEPTEWTDGTKWLDVSWNSCVMFTGLAPARIRHYAGIDNVTRAREMRADFRVGPTRLRRAHWHLRMRGWLPLRVGLRYAKHALGRAVRSRRRRAT